MDAARPADVSTGVRVAVPPQVLVEALTALAGAPGRLEVAEAVLPLLVDLPGVRAGAVVERAGADVVVQGSWGYDCDAMGPGTRLPLDAGLPVTEAVRTDRAVARGPGPSWVAVPFRRRGAGALLLSLHVAPPDDLAPLVAIAHAVGLALDRVGRTERSLGDLAVLTAAAAAGTGAAALEDPALDVVVRSQPHDGSVGGDVLLTLPDGRGGSWLVVADVCGSGLAAALVARPVTTAVRALATRCTGPAELLEELERSVLPVVGPGTFVTALVVHLGVERTTVASAGHPPPLLLLPSGAAATVPVPAGQPLALETGRDEPYHAVPVVLPAQALVLLHTDGLTERGGARDTDPLELLRGVPHTDPETVAELVLAAAERAGPATDDVAVMVVRPAFRRQPAG